MGGVKTQLVFCFGSHAAIKIKGKDVGACKLFARLKKKNREGVYPGQVKKS